MPVKTVAEAERWDICAQALELARRADAVGLPIAAYLLESAAVEARPGRQRNNRKPSDEQK